MTIPFLSVSQNTTTLPKAIGITASLPWVNSYSYYDYDSKKSSAKSGFIGLGASAFYKTGKNKLSLNFGFTGDLPVPIGPFDQANEGTRTNIFSTFWEGLYHRNLFYKVNLITGLNYVNYHFNFTSFVDSLPSFSKFDKSIGFTIGSEFRFSKNSAVALFYRPTIISLNKKQYRHLISLDLGFSAPIFELPASFSDH
ncbi:MAG: hypothetical protein ABI921_06075 [Panacibacter sp.]